MKKIIISSGMLISNLIFSQVGINTPSPQGTFHVDGAKDNVSTGVPTAAQQSNDFVVLSNGNVGVGTVNPANKLEIRSATSGAIKIVDGTQADGAIFTSDANGVGSWKITAVTKSTVSGTFPTVGTNVLSGGGTTPKYSNVSITLTPGKWIVNAGMTMYNRSEIIEKSRVWLHAYLSSSVTSIQRNGFTLSGPSGNNTSYAGVLTKGNGSSSGNDNDLNFLSGSSMIEVTAASVTLYLLIEDKPVNTWEFNPRAWENYFYAIPIN